MNSELMARRQGNIIEQATPRGMWPQPENAATRGPDGLHFSAPPGYIEPRKLCRDVTLARLGCQEVALYSEHSFVCVQHPAIGRVTLSAAEAKELGLELIRLAEKAQRFENEALPEGLKNP